MTSDLSIARDTAADDELTASVLFEPVQISKTTIPNRIAMAPMTREFSPGGVPGDDVIEYYRRRAAGGAGLIFTEGMSVDTVGAHDGPIPALTQPDTLAALGRIAKAVQKEGAKFMPQLWHVGVQDGRSAVNPATIKQRPPRAGPSGLSGLGEHIGHTMSEAEIETTIEAFASATRSVRDAGCDGINIHGAHGYLLDQFLWSRTNKRSDHFGGNIAERTRFAVDLLRACKQAAGADFPIVLRISQWKSLDYGARLADTPEELAQILTPLVDAGADAFDCSTRRFWEPEFAGSDLSFAGWVKKLSGRPAIAVGSITLATEFKSGTTAEVGGIAASGPRSADIGLVSKLIRKGDFDMVGIGRAMIANPDWGKLVREGRSAELRSFEKSDLATLA